MTINLIAQTFQLPIMFIVFAALPLQFSIVFAVFLPLLLKSPFMGFADSVQGKELPFGLYVMQNIVKTLTSATTSPGGLERTLPRAPGMAQ